MIPPERIAEQLDALRHQIARNATDVREVELRAADASEEYLRAYARAYAEAVGTAKERDQAATLASLPARRVRDRAQIEVAYLKQRARDVEAQQSNLQTLARIALGGAS